MRPEGFYRIRLEGQPGVAYCHHEDKARLGGAPYEVWTTLLLFDRFDGHVHPATSTIIPNICTDATLRRLEVLSPLNMDIEMRATQASPADNGPGYCRDCDNPACRKGGCMGRSSDLGRKKA